MPVTKPISALLDAHTARCLCRVVELGSFTRAAERLHTSKSQISRTISNLEQRLGVQIFHRMGRKLPLTQTGIIIHETCMSVLATLDMADQQLIQLRAGVGQQIRIAAPTSIGNLLLAPIISDFMKEHPDVLFEASWQNQTMNLLAEGFDIAFQLGPLPDSALITRRIATFEYYCCAAPSYVKRHGAPALPADLAQHERIAFSSKSYDPTWRFASGGSIVEIPDDARMIVNSYPLAAQLCIDGLGITRLPTYFCERDIRRGKLVRVLEPFHQPKKELFALMAPKPRLSNVGRKFLNLCVDRMHAPQQPAGM